MADISVQVSSAGLTAYGAGTWDSSSFGGDNVTNISIGSVDAFYPDEGWGGNQWGYLVWGQNFEDVSITSTTNLLTLTLTSVSSVTGDANLTLSTNVLTLVNSSVSAEIAFAITLSTNVLNTTVANVFGGELVEVSVTTPGSSTTWGQGNYGQYAWNQITGVEVDIGDETIEATGSVTLSTNLLNITAVTTSITADANLTLSTNIINVTTASITTKIDTSVEVTAPGSLGWGFAPWSDGTWGEIGGMFASQGAEEESVPGVEVNLSTNLLTLTLTSVSSVTGDANVTASTNLLTTSLGDEDVVPNTLVTLSTNLLNVSMGTASGEVLSLISVTGVNMTGSTGRLFIAAWAVVDIGVTNTWSVVDIAA